jgi:glucosyl-3-phosphoglycerate synthase
MSRDHHHSEFPLELLLERKEATVSVVLPAREEAATVGQIVERILALGDLVDQVLVLDADSLDGTGEVAARAGAEVVSQSSLFPELGPVRGKGDAMWRGLRAVTGEVVVYVDADTREFEPRFVTGLVGPLLLDAGARFVKGSYSRPFAAGDTVLPGGGGRVSQLTARPLLSAFYPDLAGILQPLAGEIAAPRDVLERIPFATGYAVEMAMLLDVRSLVGAAAIAQVDIGERRQPHQALDALRPMAETVLGVVCERLRREGRLAGPADGAEIFERPPFATVHAAA